MPELYAHQKETRDLIIEKHKTLIFSDPGTGKTASVLVAIQALQKAGYGRALVLAPKAILEPAWGDDCRTFTPGVSCAIAYASNRKKAFDLGTRIVATNHDATTWLAKNPEVLKGFDIVVFDESTAYKNKNAQRSKAIAKLVDKFDFPIRIAMTGTPMPNGLIDLWHQVYLTDSGERLGNRFYSFRAATHEPVEHFGFKTWEEKDGCREAVADLLADITVRHRFEDCVDVPENNVVPLRITLSAKLQKLYDQMVKEALLQIDDVDDITTPHAAAQVTKLLQIASGAVYDSEGNAHVLSTERYELIAELCAQRDHTVVGFVWRHQRDELLKALKKVGITDTPVIDGASKNTPAVVKDFQAGKNQVLLAQPQSAAHGLTLTRASTLIWSSPTYDAERFEQFSRRIYRTGQKRKTETILIEAKNTLEPEVYAKLQGKVGAQSNLLGLLQTLSHAA